MLGTINRNLMTTMTNNQQSNFKMMNNLLTLQENHVEDFFQYHGEAFLGAFEQLIELEPEKATKIMTQVITNGEVDFDPAIKYGGAAASLDIVSNFFVWGKAVKGIPMSTVRDMLRGRIKKVVTSKGAKAVYGATGIETVTESLQEKLGFEGVEAATGYGGVPEENIKRMLDGTENRFERIMIKNLFKNK